MKKASMKTEEIGILMQCDVWVFAFPLYVDAVPSHLLSCMIALEEIGKKQKKEAMVYAFVNSGFYEAHQNTWAIAVMKNWCNRAGFIWGQAIAVGGGGMLVGVKDVPMGHGPLKNLGKAMEEMAQHCMEKRTGEDILVKPNFPRFLYQRMAELGWRKQAKQYGWKAKDLSRKMK